MLPLTKALILASFLPVLCGNMAGAEKRDVLDLGEQGGWVELPPNFLNDLDQATIEACVKWHVLGSRFFGYGSATPAVPTHQWYHIAVVTGKQGLHLYLNGGLIATNDYSGSFSAIDIDRDLARFRLGRFVTNNEPIVRGQFADVRVWNVARTADEIRGSMFQKLTGTEAGLVGFRNFQDAAANHVPRPAHIVSSVNWTFGSALPISSQASGDIHGVTQTRDGVLRFGSSSGSRSRLDTRNLKSYPAEMIATSHIIKFHQCHQRIGCDYRCRLAYCHAGRQPLVWRGRAVALYSQRRHGSVVENVYDRGWIWIGTQRGLSRYARREQHGARLAEDPYCRQTSTVAHHGQGAFRSPPSAPQGSVIQILRQGTFQTEELLADLRRVFALKGTQT